MAEFKIPTETVTLPSKGAFYSENNPLSKGTVEIKYMTAKEEDILTNQSYIENGTVIDKLLKAVVVTKFDWDELLRDIHPIIQKCHRGEERSLCGRRWEDQIVTNCIKSYQMVSNGIKWKQMVSNENK